MNSELIKVIYKNQKYNQVQAAITDGGVQAMHSLVADLCLSIGPILEII